MNTLRVAIAGATGRMGRGLIALAAADPTVQLVAATTTADDPLLGQDAGHVAWIDPLGVPITTEITTPCDVLIEFTLPPGCAAWARWCAAAGAALVSGTTGLDSAATAALDAAARTIPVVWAPNMSIGINLLLEAVADVARKLSLDWDVEISEIHHRRKVDAPSGTAQALAEAICAARGQDPEQTIVYGREGPCGPRPPGQVGMHALRMGAIVGEHEVHFTCEAESVTLRHRVFSRDTFCAGALRAARWLPGRPPGRYTMRDVLAG